MKMRVLLAGGGPPDSPLAAGFAVPVIGAMVLKPGIQHQVGFQKLVLVDL